MSGARQGSCLVPTRLIRLDRFAKAQQQAGHGSSSHVGCLAPDWSCSAAYDLLVVEERKQAEVDYPLVIGEEGRRWLRTKPFGNAPRETARMIIDFGYVVQLLDLQPGMRLVELGCGPGWMTRFAARHGVEAVGYDIAPDMIEIARQQTAAESVDATFEVGDMEALDLGRSFDACLFYDTIHHTPRADLVFAAAARALRPGGRVLLAEPNWKQRYEGRQASHEWGTTELGYSPRVFKRLLRAAGFTRIERFHNNRKRLYGNRPADLFRHLAEPFVYRALGPWWTQIWLRATAP
jgi:2-polyprenyl-3-methyl-5-hydroxy-6-metoxy-1,4-benzoquinol methylase